MSSDDLTSILTQLTKTDTEIGYRSGMVTAWNNDTGANTIVIAGTPITDVPFLSRTEALAIQVGDVVGILRVKSQYFVLGRISVDPGEIVVRDSNGEIGVTIRDGGIEISGFGRLTAPAGGSILMQDNGGQLRAYIGGFETGDAWFQVRDAANGVVFTDDTSGVGMGRPYLPVAMYPANSGAYMTTTSSSFTELWRGRLIRSHPRLRVELLASVSASTTGQARLMIGGAQVGSTLSLPADTHAFYTIGPVTIPAGGDYSTELLTIEARRVTGTGTVGIGMYGVEREQS